MNPLIREIEALEDAALRRRAARVVGIGVFALISAWCSPALCSGRALAVALVLAAAPQVAKPALAQTVVDTTPGKAEWAPDKRKVMYSEFCAAFWYTETCGTLEDAVAKGVCSQQEADNNDPLPTINCTPTKADQGWCRGNPGCTAAGVPWNCCDGLDSGTCPFGGSSNTPRENACKAAFQIEMNRLWNATKQEGRQAWRDQDNPRSVADDTDPVEETPP